jgi:hypothetical protein
MLAVCHVRTWCDEDVVVKQSELRRCASAGKHAYAIQKTSAVHCLLIFSARCDHVVNKLGEALHVDLSNGFCRVPVATC